MHPMRSSRAGIGDSRRQGACRGFTLIELIVAIVLIALLAAAAVPMLQLPMRAYLDATRRADLSSELDVAAGKLRDDLAQALPNSVRVRQVGGTWYLEYLQVRAVGRYRSADAVPPAAPACPATCTGAGARDVLNFGTPDACFATLGPLQGGAAVAGSDQVVVGPMGGNVYLGGAAANPWRARLLASTAAGGGRCLRTVANTFVTPPANRLAYVVAQPVSYQCNPATGRLTRVWGYPLVAVQPVAFGAAPSAPLATHVAGCSMAVTPTGPPTAPTGHVVSVSLRLSRATEGTAAPESAEAALQFSVREAP